MHTQSELYNLKNTMCTVNNIYNILLTQNLNSVVDFKDAFLLTFDKKCIFTQFLTKVVKLQRGLNWLKRDLFGLF